MKIIIGYEQTSQTHFKNTGVAIVESYVELKQGGDTIAGSLAMKAYWAHFEHFKQQRPTIEQRAEFYTQWAKDNYKEA